MVLMRYINSKNLIFYKLTSTTLNDIAVVGY